MNEKPRVTLTLNVGEFVISMRDAAKKNAELLDRLNKPQGGDRDH